MAFFVVTYDIKTGNDPQPLVDALDLLDSVHTQLSVWLVSADETQSGLYRKLEPLIHIKDKLMVIQFSERPNYNRAMQGTNDWLDRHFP